MINVQQILVQCEWRNCIHCFEDHSDYLTILLDTDVSPLIQSVSVCVYVSTGRNASCIG